MKEEANDISIFFWEDYSIAIGCYFPISIEAWKLREIRYYCHRLRNLILKFLVCDYDCLNVASISFVHSQDFAHKNLKRAFLRREISWSKTIFISKTIQGGNNKYWMRLNDCLSSFFKFFRKFFTVLDLLILLFSFMIFTTVEFILVKYLNTKLLTLSNSSRSIL